MTRASKSNPSYRLFVGAHSTAARITAAWMQPGNQPGAPMTVEASHAGIDTLQQQLGATGIAPAHTLVVPHTGHPAWLDLASTLSRAGYAISPINPARARALAVTLLQAGDSDTLDAGTLAHLAALLQPAPWSPTAATAAEVRRLLDERATLVGLLQRLEQQRPTANPRQFDALQTGLHSQLHDLEQRLVGLLSNDAAWAAAAQRLAQLSDEGLMAALWQVLTTRTPQSFDLLRSTSSRYLPKNPRRALLHFSRPVAIATLALALTAGPTLPAALAQDGDDLASPQALVPTFPVNTIDGDQYDSAVARDNTGNITVVAWDSDNTSTSGDDGIYIKGYDSAGMSIFGETQVFTDTSITEASTPDVAMDDDGDFVVVWQTYATSFYYDILAQRYNSDGTPNGPRILVAQESWTLAEPAVAMDDVGNFVVTWFENYNSGPYYYEQISAVRYDSAGAQQGGLIVVDTAAVANNEAVSSPDVAMDDDANFVVVWDESYYDSGASETTTQISAQRYTAAGAADGSLQTLATVTAGTGDTSYVQNPAADMNSTGTFAAAWEEFDDANDRYYLVYVSYDTSGTQDVDENVLVNTSFGNAENAAVTIDDTGTVIAVAESLTTGSDEIIFYESSASPGSFEFVTQITQTADAPAIASDSDGDFIITWDGYYSSSETQEVLAYGFETTDTTPVVDATNSTLNYSASSGAVEVDPSISVSDPDSTNLASATIEISNGFVSGEDTLVVQGTLPVDITASTPTSDTIVLTGTTTVGNYQDALRQIAYENTAGTPTAGTRTVTFTVSDGTETGSDTRDISIAASNVAPTIDTSNSALDYTEGDGVVSIDSSVTITDTGDVLSATVEISSGFVSSEDALAVEVTLPVDITADTSAEDAITLSGVASAADYQEALRQIGYLNTSDDPDTTTRTVRFTVEDVGNETASATRNITITPTNDAPEVTPTSSSLGYLSGAGQVVIDPNVNVTDPDNTDLVSATVQISSGFVSGEDTLVVQGTLPVGITSSTPTSDTIVLTGTTTVGNYQDALRLIAYENLATTLTGGTRTVTFTAYDLEGGEGSGTRDITVGTQNTAPTVNTSAGALDYTENEPATRIDTGITVADAEDTELESATVEITGNFVDGEDELSVAGSLPSGISADTSMTGTITLTGTETITDYQTALSQIAYQNTSDDPDTSTRTVTFSVSDGTDSGSATRDIDITAVNDAPTVNNTSTTLEYRAGDGAVIIDPGTLVDDDDNTNLMTATVEISGFIDTEDVLGIQGMLPPSISADTSMTGTITLTGTATITDYQAALRQITYENTSSGPTIGMRTVTFKVYDPEGAEGSDIRRIDVRDEGYETYLPLVAKP